MSNGPGSETLFVKQIRAHRLDRLLNYPIDLSWNFKGSTQVEWNPATYSYTYYWRGRDGTRHHHDFESLASWHNQYEPGYINEDELKLVRMKVLMTTC